LSAVRAGTATKHHYTWKVKIRHHKVTKGQQAAIARAAKAPSNGSSCGVMNRTNNCGAEGLSLTLVRLDDGVPDGTEEWLFAAVDYIGTRWKSKTFSDAMAVVGLSREGDDFVSEPTISVTATCRCSSTNGGIIMAGPLSDALAGSLHHTAHIGTGQVLNATPEYEMTGSAEGGSGGFTWFGDSEVRCDHVFAVAGCVFPEYWPTVDMSGLPHIAPHILLVEGRGAHLGNAAYNSPLSKGTGRQQARNNRRQVCHGKPRRRAGAAMSTPLPQRRRAAPRSPRSTGAPPGFHARRTASRAAFSAASTRSTGCCRTTSSSSRHESLGRNPERLLRSCGSGPRSG